MAIAMGSIQVTRARHTVVYEIVVQKNTVEIVASGRATGEVDWQVVKTVGSVKTPISVTTGTNEFSLNGGVTWKTASNDSKNTFNSGTAIVDSSTAPSSIIMRCTVEGTVVCTKELSFAKELSEITSANVYYILADNDTKEPTDSELEANAKDKFNDLTLLPNKYVWQATKVHYTNGTFDWTGKLCLGKTENYKSGTEIYALSDSGTSAPGLPGTDNAATWRTDTKFDDSTKLGKYLWTSTRLTWTTNNITYTTPVCIGYYGNDGTSGGGSRIRYALSAYATSTDNRTPPADLRGPFYWNGNGYLGVYHGNNVASEYKTFNGVTYDDGFLMWKLAMPTPTTDKPYIWALSYVLVDGENEYNVRSVDNDTFTYARNNGKPGDKGDPGDPGDPGTPATYYEIRFKRQNFNVLVRTTEDDSTTDYPNGFVRVDFECSVYKVVGESATEDTDGSASVKFTFRDKNGNPISNLGIDNPTTKPFSSSTNSITFNQDLWKDSSGYYGRDTQIVDCLCEIVSSASADKREVVVPLNFSPAHVFIHDDMKFESLFQSGSKFSLLQQNVDGLQTHVRMMVQNLLMGTTTAIGWTEEKSQSYVDKFAFTSGSRQFVMHNYWPIGIENYGSDQGTSNPEAYETLKSPIIKIQRGKYYILSFKGSCDSNVIWNAGIRFGTSSLCNQEAKYFQVYWNGYDAVYSYANKKQGVVCRYDDDTDRFFVFFQASTDYDYMQVLFINAIRKNSTTVSTKTNTSDWTRVNASWPSSYPSSAYSRYEYKSSDVFYDAEKNTKTTRHYYAIYTGSTGYYYTYYTDVIEYMDTPMDLNITEPQLELSSVTDIKDIVPSPYTETQNVVESYIQQTVDSIRIKANTVVINDKFWVDSNGDVHMNNAHLAGVLSSGSGVKQITIGGNDQNGEINVGGYITLHYDANIEGDKIYGTSINGEGGVITVKGTPANIVYLNYQPTQITGYSVYSMGAYFRGLMVSKDGIDVTGGSLRLSSISSGSVAINNDSNGYIKGARFKTETLNTSKSYAYETDVRNIICTNTSAITIQLPSSPVLGDELIIIQEGAKIDFISPSIKFKYSNSDIGTTANSDSTGQLNYFLFDGTYWHARYIKVGRPW